MSIKSKNTNQLTFIVSLLLLFSCVLSIGEVNTNCDKSCSTCEMGNPNKCIECDSGYTKSNDLQEHPTGCKTSSGGGGSVFFWFFCCCCCCCCSGCCIALAIAMVYGLGQQGARPRYNQTAAMNNYNQQGFNNGGYPNNQMGGGPNNMSMNPNQSQMGGMALNYNPNIGPAPIPFNPNPQVYSPPQIQQINMPPQLQQQNQQHQPIPLMPHGKNPSPVF